MTDERKLEIVRQFKEEIYKRFNLNVMSDENLETVIEQMIVEKLGSEYITIEERVDIMERVYSSILVSVFWTVLSKMMILQRL